MKKVFLLLALAMTALQGCLGCDKTAKIEPGIEMEMREEKMRQQMAEEEEKIRRIALEVYNSLETERRKSQPQPIMTMPEKKEEPKISIPIQKNFAIESSDAAKRLIVFVAKKENVDETSARTFGHVRALSIVEGMDRWELKVKASYDFDEVLDYLRSFER